jgi:hypothetical protein
MKTAHQISDTTNSSTSRIKDSNTFYSEWDENLNLILLKVNGTLVTKDGVLDEKHWDYNKAKVAKSRHLKKIKIKLKIQEMKPVNSKKVLVKIYNDYEFELGDFEIGSKMYKSHRISNLHMFDDNPENRALAIEHNEVIKEIKKLQDKIRDINKKMK